MLGGTESAGETDLPAFNSGTTAVPAAETSNCKESPAHPLKPWDGPCSVGIVHGETDWHIGAFGIKFHFYD